MYPLRKKIVGCVPSDVHRTGSPNSSDSDANQAGRKRRISQVTSSSSRQEDGNERSAHMMRNFVPNRVYSGCRLAML
ncbi:hypothetical protein N7447_000038 [Penicillium robsamsonii]|uniref:uncharacterized protein n=1 Tax=Penicillium robsamsonii TaxID=1792511 RepID=UPI002546DA57|nr:uncharacterized protein N7447_000038 [Penicillium robsamsonii]KAJ5834012.1 hypothetical protein N7447_000038 [Penicillium robsamsonii]